MRALATELKKLFSNKIFLLIIAAVFVLNGYLIFRTANSGEAKPSDYNTVYTELKELSDDEKLNWLDERLNDFSGQQPYNWEVLAELRDECANIVGYSDYLASIESTGKTLPSYMTSNFT